MSASFLAAFIAASASALAECPALYISDVLHRPNYRSAYERMVEGQGGLPRWMATPSDAERATGTPAQMMKVGRDDNESFWICEPHNCDASKLYLIFGQYGDSAKGLLLVERRQRFIGNPSREERQALSAMKAQD